MDTKTKLTTGGIGCAAITCGVLVLAGIITLIVCIVSLTNL